MAGGFSGLAGLSGVYPGMLQTAKAEDEVDAYQTQKRGQELFGNTLKMLAGQGQPQQPQMQPLQPYGGAPQQPPQAGPPPGGFRPPGQIQPMPGGGPPGAPQQPPGSPPSAPAGGPPGRPPLAGGAAAPTPAPGGGPSQAQGGPIGQIAQLAQSGQLDIRTAATLIARANPNASPRDIVSALNVAMPYLKAEEQLQVAQLRIDLQEKSLRERHEALYERERHDVQMEDIQRERTGQAEERIKQGQERLDIAHQREARLEAHQTFNQDQQLKNYALKQLQFEEKARATGRKEDIENARQMFMAGRDLARLRLQEHSFMVDMSPEQKKQMDKDIDSIYQDYVGKLKTMGGGSAPSTPVQTGTPRTNSQTEWFKAQSKNWSPEQRAKVIQDLKDAGYDTSGLQ